MCNLSIVSVFIIIFAEDQKEKELILNQDCRNRELFLADEDITDIFPVSHLRYHFFTLYMNTLNKLPSLA